MFERRLYVLGRDSLRERTTGSDAARLILVLHFSVLVAVAVAGRCDSDLFAFGRDSCFDGLELKGNFLSI